MGDAVVSLPPLGFRLKREVPAACPGGRATEVAAGLGRAEGLGGWSSASSGSCRRKGRGEGRLATVSPPGSPLSSRSTQLRLCHLDSHAELFLAEWRISSLASSGPSITATAFIFAKPRSRHPQLLV